MIDKQDNSEKNSTKKTKGLSKWWRQRSVYFKLYLAVLTLVALYMAPSMFYTIEAGEGGVVWLRFFGGVKLDEPKEEGYQFVFPWDKLAVYNLRIQQMPILFQVLDKAGLRIDVEVSVRYHPVRDQLPLLHQEVGREYATKIVAPEVQALIREVFSRYSAEELYTTKRYLLQNVISSAKNEIADRYIILDDLLIKKLSLPKNIAAAIERKLTQFYLVQEYGFKLEVEEKEAQRKRIEAQGINDFQEIISGGLTERFLQFKGIEATRMLATSSNAKVIIVGGGKNGLPIIFNADTMQTEESK